MLCITLAFAIAPNKIANAENTSLVVDLNADSYFDAYADIFTYTYGTSLYIAKDNTISSYPNAFAGSCVGLVMNRNNILLLAKNGTTYSLYYFDYDEHGIKSAQSRLGALKNTTETISKITKDNLGNFYFLRNFSTETNQLKVFAENAESISALERVDSIAASYQVQDYLYYPSSSYIYAIIGGEIYRAYKGDDIVPSSSNEFTKITSITGATRMIYFDGDIIVNTTSGMYKINVASLESAKLTDDYASGNIATSSIDLNMYIFAHKGSSIYQYAYDGTSCTYFNKFDNSEYVHPTTFDLVYVAKLTSNEADLYSSPRNMQITSTLSLNDYFLVLTQITYEDSNSTFYYVTKQDGTKGYLKAQSATFTKIDPNTDAKSLAIGLYAQGLFPETTVYKYPYADAEALTTIVGYGELIVVDNVAQEGDKQVWNYYKISYVSNGEILTGYVKITDVSPYTRLTAPTVLKSVKISADSIGSLVYLYALPTEESTQVAALTDGEELNLAEEFNKNAKWTKVIYKDTYAYVLTSQISQKGLTALQITLIVISCVIVAASIVMIIVMKKKRKIGF